VKVSYNEIKQYDKAIKDLNRAIQLNPNYALAYNNRGNAYYALNKFEKAMDDYSQTLEIDPNYATAYYNLANIYAEKLKQYEKAIENYNKAVELDPNYAVAYNSRGVAYYYLMQYKKAIVDYNKAMELIQDCALFYRNRGIVYFELAQYNEALKDFNRAIELDPTEIESHGGRGLTHSKLKEYNKALKDFKNAGILSIKSQRLEGAIEAFSLGFKLKKQILNDDIVYCGMFLFVITLDNDVLDEIRKTAIENDKLKLIYNFLLKKLRNEYVNLEEIKKQIKSEDLKLLLEFLNGNI
jgi:tetratricopeptide (TPR) repeat protein